MTSDKPPILTGCAVLPPMNGKPKRKTAPATERTGKTNQHRTEPAGFGPLAADAAG